MSLVVSSQVHTVFTDFSGFSERLYILCSLKPSALRAETSFKILAQLDQLLLRG